MHTSRSAIPLVLAFVALITAGCQLPPARGVARDATWGVMDGLSHPPPEDRLAVKIHTLAERFVDQALEPGTPPAIGEISAQVTEGVLAELSSSAPEIRRMVGPIVHEAVAAGLAALTGGDGSLTTTMSQTGETLSSGVIRGLARERSAIATLAREASAAAAESFAQVASSRLASVKSDLRGNGRVDDLGSAIAAIVQQASAAAVAGALGELDRQLADCTGPPEECPPNVVRRIGRSAAIGATEGVQREIELWPLALSFVIGAAVAALIVWLVVSRRAVVARP